MNECLDGVRVSVCAFRVSVCAFTVHTCTNLVAVLLM